MNPIDYWYKKYLKEKEKKYSIKPPVPEALKLTWQDVKRIFDIHQVIFEEEVESQESGQGLIHVTEEEFYKDLTKRFNNGECT